MSIAVKELKNEKKLKFQVQGELGSNRENKQRCENKICGPCVLLNQMLVLMCCECLANELMDRVIIMLWHKKAVASQEIQDGVRCDSLRLRAAQFLHRINL